MKIKLDHPVKAERSSTKEKHPPFKTQVLFTWWMAIGLFVFVVGLIVVIIISLTNPSLLD